jgi:signal transduction histidine kinase
MRPRVALVAALGATAVLFLSHELATREAFDVSLSGVADIVDNAMPSVLDLAELRAAVSQLRSEIGQGSHATEGDRIELVQRVESLLARADDRIHSYRSLPSFASERELWEAFDRAVDALRATARAAASAPETDAAAKRAFVQVATSLDRIAATLVETNAREAERAAREVLVTHERAKAHSADFLLAVLLGVIGLGVFAERWIARSERETDRLIAELDAFSSRVAHDLRGPLNPVALALGLVKASPSIDDRARHVISVAESSLGRTLSLIEGLLAFARSGARPEPGARCEVARVLDDVATSLHELAADERAELSLDAPPGLRAATTEVVLASIVANLARNALLYLGDSDRRVVTVRAHDEGAVVRIEVADSGPGIPPDVEKRLFHPFERGSSRPGGHGLGLTIVKRLAEAHSGKVTVRSQLGLGTTFEVVLPRG